jgi:hypothetical protein
VQKIVSSFSAIIPGLQLLYNSDVRSILFQLVNPTPPHPTHKPYSI